MLDCIIWRCPGVTIWSEVRALQSRLLLVEIKALYRKDQLVNYIRLHILPNYTLSGRAVQSLLQRLVSVAGRTRGKLETVTILHPRVRQRRPHTVSTGCTYHLRRDRGGTSKRQHSSVKKCGGPGTQPLNTEGTPESSWSGCGSRDTSRNTPGTSRIAIRQASR